MGVGGTGGPLEEGRPALRREVPMTYSGGDLDRKTKS